MKRILSIFLTVVTTTSMFGSLVFAQSNTEQDPALLDKGITISPIRFEYSAKPGETINDIFKLYNSTSSDKTIYLYKLNFTSDGVSGAPLFFTKEIPFESSLKDWMKIEKESVLVPKVAADNPHIIPVKFSITIPQNAEPGGHYAGIIASLVKPGENKVEKGNLAFKDERAAIVIINVEGDTKSELSVDSFYATDPFSTQKPLIRIFEWMPVAFLTELRNYGNTHTVPKGNIIILNGDTKIDEIKFNESEGTILRESSRTFNDIWSGSLFELAPYKNTDGNVVKDEKGNIKNYLSLNFQRLTTIRFGKYTAKLVIGYDDNGQKKSLIKEFDFWVIPWKLILAILLVITLYVVYRVRKSKKSKRSSK